MSLLIEKARIMLSLRGNYLNSDILRDTNIVSPCADLSDEEYRVLMYFTAVGTGKIYRHFQEYGESEIKDLLDFFDRILQNLGHVEQNIVFRMDSYEDYLDKDEYMEKYRNYMRNGVILKVPWALSASLENWNCDCPQYPIWEIELLPNKSQAHPIYPYIKEYESKAHETEVRFESNTLLKVVSVSEKDGYPYIKMKETLERSHSNIISL